MFKKFKKLMAFMLAFAMVVTSVPSALTTVYAADTKTSSGVLKWDGESYKNDNTVTVSDDALTIIKKNEVNADGNGYSTVSMTAPTAKILVVKDAFDKILDSAGKSKDASGYNATYAYQWYSYNIATEKWDKISAATGATFAPGKTGLYVDSKYKCVVSATKLTGKSNSTDYDLTASDFNSYSYDVTYEYDYLNKKNPIASLQTNFIEDDDSDNIRNGEKATLIVEGINIDYTYLAKAGYGSIDTKEEFIDKFGALKYTWYTVAADGSETVIQGENNSSCRLVIDPTKSYKVVVTNDGINKYFANSTPAAKVWSGYTEDDGFYVYDKSQYTNTVKLGASVKLYAKCKADKDYTITYQWYNKINDNGVVSWKAMEGKTSDTLEIPTTTEADYLGNPDETHRLEVSVKKGDNPVKTRRFDFRIVTPDELSLVETNIGEAYRAKEVVINYPDYASPTTMFVKAKSDNGRTISYQWYKMVTKVEYYVSGNTQVDPSVTVPAEGTYDIINQPNNYTVNGKAVYAKEYFKAIDGATTDTWSVDTDKIGKYLCRVTAKDVNGNEVTHIDMTGSTAFESGLRAEAKANTVIAALDESARLEVEAANDYTNCDISYAWQKKVGTDYVNLEGATSSVYIIDKVAEANYGDYRVTVSDKTGAVVYANVKLVPPSPEFDAEDESYVYLSKDQEFTLDVMASDDKYFKVNYTWYKYTNVVTGNNSGYWQIMDANESRYTVKYSSSLDLGRYKCLISYVDNDGDRVSIDKYFYVYANPDFYVQYASAKTQYKRVGDSVTYAVDVRPVNNADPSGVTYQWKYGSEEIEGATASSYTIASLTKDDFENITCYVSYNNVVIGSKTFYTYFPSDVAIIGDTELEVAYGTDLTISPKVYNPSNLPLTFKWESNAGYNSDGWNVMPGETNSFVTINNVQKNDLGRYRLTAYYNELNVATYVVDVVKASNSVYVYRAEGYDNNVKVAPNGSTELKVVAESITGSPVRFQWFKGSKALAGQTSDTLKLTNVLDDSYYYCRVYDTESDDKDSVGFYVEVSTNLDIDNGYLNYSDVVGYETNIGDAVTLKANATIDAGHSMYYQWYRYDYVLEKYVAIVGATADTYSIMNIQIDQLGRYRCEVNDAGYDSQVITYNVYVDTGYYAEEGNMYPRADKDGSVTMFVNASVNKGHSLSYQWYQYDYTSGDYVAIAGATANKYKVAKLTKAVAKDYLLVVKTDLQEEYWYPFEIHHKAKMDQSGEYFEPGTKFTMNVTLFNKLSDANYRYEWYQEDTNTGGMKKMDCTSAKYTATMPKGEAFDTVKYICKVYCDDVDLWAGDDIEFDTIILPKVNYSSNLPSTDHPMKVYNSVQGYKGSSSAKHMRLTFHEKSDVAYFVIDAKGNQVSNIPHTNSYLVDGNKCVIIAYNSLFGGWGYQVTSAKTADSKVTLKSKTFSYTGKQVKLKATVKGSKGDVSYSYYSDKNCTKELTNAPINVGTYYAKATVAADDNYGAATSGVAKITIKKSTPVIKVKNTTITLKAKDLKKSAKTVSMGASSTVIGLKIVKKSGSAKLKLNSNGTITVAKGTKKGTYKMVVKLSVAKTSNNNAKSVTKTIKVVVK